MFGYISIKEQVIEERKKNAALKEQTDQNTANIDYIAMMSDIELEPDPEIEPVPEAEEPATDGETTETEVDEDEQQI